MTKALGITDEVTACDCCGKADLKCTVAIELDDGQIVHYGRTCASRNTGKPAKQINSEVRAELARKVAAASAEFLTSPEYIAERARFAERDRFPWNDARRLGMQAAEFVREARQAADAARAAIAAKHGLTAYQVGV